MNTQNRLYSQRLDQVNYGTLRIHNVRVPCTYGKGISKEAGVPFDWRSIKHLKVMTVRNGKPAPGECEISIHMYPVNTTIFLTVYAHSDVEKFSTKIRNEHYEQHASTVLESLLALANVQLRINHESDLITD